MNFKPGDFFIGIENFFSILLPGVLTTYLVLKFESGKLSSLLPVGNLNENLALFGFLFISYAVGHAVSALGGLLDEIVLDRFYDQKWRKSAGKQYKALASASSEILKSTFNLNCESEQYHIGTRPWKWAAIFVQLRLPEISNELARINADAKFLRNLLPVLFLSWYYAPFLWFHFLVIVIIGARCISLHIKYRQTAYRYLIAYSRLQAKQSQ